MEIFRDSKLKNEQKNIKNLYKHLKLLNLMKLITLHCDYIRFKALKKAVKFIEDLEDKDEKEVKEVLVVLTAVEKGDNKEILDKYIEAIKKTAVDVKAKNIVLYPYAHLSSNLGNPNEAMKFLEDAEKALKKDYSVQKAPFGYYKSFELKCKGHPLSELSKEFKIEEEIEEKRVKIKKDEVYDYKKLLNEISRSRLDTSNLKPNDHRILGQKLDLFSFNDVAPGAPFFHHNGLIIYNELLSFMRYLLNKYNYKEISTPQLLDNKLWKISGHWDHYKNNMFISDYEGKDFGVKPMNCPGGMVVYKTSTKSYKELPLRVAEFGTVHRQELSGVLAGLFRVIKFTQDDAHVFCTEEQLESEIVLILDLIEEVYHKTFNFDYKVELSTRPEKFMGKKEEWDKSEKILGSALKSKKIKYKINEGDGAFYGPKIDVHIQDSLKRSWQCATIQLDMQMPQRFETRYIGKDGKEHTPIMLHRAIFGSVERFIGILLEHLNGALPTWLSPIQVRVINFTDRNNKACEKFVENAKKEILGLRIDYDLRTVPVNTKIRDAELMKIPYIIVIGDKEEQGNTLAIRKRGKKPEFGIKESDFLNDLFKEIKERK